MLDYNTIEWKNYYAEICELANKVLDLEERTTKELGETLRAVLIECGYDVEYYGSYYPLILFAIRNEINPN